MANRTKPYDSLFSDLEAKISALEVNFNALNAIPNPLEWTEDVSKTKLDPWQSEFLLSTDKDVLMCCARQTGKSQSVSQKSAFRAKFLLRSVAVLAPTLRQSSIIYRRAKLWLERDGTEFIRSTAIELELASGGTFVAFPGDRPDLSIRGDTIDDLIVDEASRIKDSLIVAATPTTATRADTATITYLSTPAGKQGEFYKAWSREQWWTKIKVLAKECPRISEKFLERELRRLGPSLYAQEYECEFLDTPGGLFMSLDLDALCVHEHDGGMDEGIYIPERSEIW